jgi:carbon storage regulator CsrA
MLVLTGREGDRFCVGDDVIVEIARVDGGKVRLGFVAPRDVAIDRESVRLAKRAAATPEEPRR